LLLEKGQQVSVYGGEQGGILRNRNQDWIINNVTQ
jgi:hypothetical protein